MAARCIRSLLGVALALTCSNVHASVADQLLAEAIRDGSLEGVTSAVRQGANVNADTSSAESVAPPLIFAILRNRPEIIRVLIDAGADPNDPHHFDYPLVTAVNADTRVLELVLRAKLKNINAHTATGDTALEHAARCKAYIYANLLREVVSGVSHRTAIEMLACWLRPERIRTSPATTANHRSISRPLQTT